MKRNQFKIYLLTFLSVVGLASCTDLEIEETDSIITEGFQGLTDPSSTVDNLYNDIAGAISTQENLYALNEVTSDALLVPTRGTDWGDNGRWRVLHQHAWTNEQLFIINTWNQWNGYQLTASQVLDPRSNASAVNIGDASFVRAWSVWNILDLYGQVPFRDVTLPSSALPDVLTGQAAVDQILSDVDNAIANLPTTTAGSGEALGRASKAAARMLKAKVLLNKHIYTGGSPDAADMTEVVSLVDAITADGFELDPDYFGIFRDTPDSETILHLQSDVGPRIWNTLHYNSTSIESGWNGFSTLAEYYDLFEGDSDANVIDVNGGTPASNQELRRGGVPLNGRPFSGVPGTTDNGGFENGSNVGFGFLIGQQYSLQGNPLTDRQGNPLTFKREFRDGNGNINFINNDETTGIRVIKYHPKYGARLRHMIVFRYADALLMKAEAILRGGSSADDPAAIVNDLRVERGVPALGTVDLPTLLDERARELYAEGWRRNDLIRFGEFGRDWLFKEPSSVGDATKQVFPIPGPQLLANPNLVQNPGY